jgi:hypothetical protein
MAHTGIVHQHIDAAVLALDVLDRTLNRRIILDVDLQRHDFRLGVRDLILQCRNGVCGFGERATAH